MSNEKSTVSLFFEQDVLGQISELVDLKYEKDNELASIRGIRDEFVTAGENYHSLVSKIHVIKLANNFPANEEEYATKRHFFEPKSVADLCRMGNKSAHKYEVEDFLYCRFLGLPINRMITLRRFSMPVIDNIFTKRGKGNPDVARLVTYMTNEVNKMEDMLSISYGMRWKELSSEMEQNSMYGDQAGVSGFMKTMLTPFDSTLGANNLSGASTGGPMSQYDPKHDQNRVYGPVNSIANTTIQDVGLDFNKEFEIQFDYELRSINGRSGEYAMRDIIANILAVTFNDGTFWGGSRYWVGEQPTPLMNKLQWMNSRNLDTVLSGATRTIREFIQYIQDAFKDKGSAMETLRKVMRGALMVGLGKIMDAVGRPGIVASNSLLKNEPTGCWHLTIGNPYNPIMVIGNLIMQGAEIKFPTDALSYGDFPTKLSVSIKLKPGMPKDRAGAEMIFNGGQKRLYWAPKKAKRDTKRGSVVRKYRDWEGYNSLETAHMLETAYTFIDSGKREVIRRGSAEKYTSKSEDGKTQRESPLNQGWAVITTKDGKSSIEYKDSYEQQIGGFITENGIRSEIPGIENDDLNQDEESLRQLTIDKSKAEGLGEEPAYSDSNVQIERGSMVNEKDFKFFEQRQQDESATTKKKGNLIKSGKLKKK